MDEEFAKFYQEGDDDEKESSEKPAETSEQSAKKSTSPCEKIEEASTTKEDKKPENEPVIDSSNNTPSNEHMRYENGECIYTNPETKQEYVWSEDMKQWVPKGFKPVFDGQNYTYTDSEGMAHKWNAQSSRWEKSDSNKEENNPITYGFDGENHTYTDPKDNTVYIWDREKNAWFPKVDEDFMARYQMSYGFVENTTKTDEKEKIEKPQEKRKAPAEPSWFDLDDEHNTKVYASNLPEQLTEQEFVDFMQKCGLVLKDMKTNKYKVKMYKEADGTFKGDALCDYIKIESVDLALKILDGADLKGKQVKIQRAKFQMKGQYNPSLKPKKKRKRDKEKEKKTREKLLDWRPDKLRGEREKNERTVVIKNLFSPSTFDENVELILEFTEDIRTEATKCGIVRKVTLYDKNPEGVATVTFSDAEEADICVKFFNNRWFGKRRITAETWDGKEKYKIVESEAEKQERMNKWNTFLETDASANDKVVEDVKQ